jgi:hypothetical protein
MNEKLNSIIEQSEYLISKMRNENIKWEDSGMSNDELWARHYFHIASLALGYFHAGTVDQKHRLKKIITSYVELAGLPKL